MCATSPTRRKSPLTCFRCCDGQGFDRKGLIYGMGHAVYSISDPRATIFKGFVKKLAEEKGTPEGLRALLAR